MKAFNTISMFTVLAMLGACDAKPSFLLDGKEQKNTQEADAQYRDQDPASEDAIAEVATEEQDTVEVQVGGQPTSTESNVGMAGGLDAAPEAPSSDSTSSNMTMTPSGDASSSTTATDSADSESVDDSDTVVEDDVSTAEVAECRSRFGGEDAKTVIAGSKKKMTIEVGSLLIIKVVGNQNLAELNLVAGEEMAKLAGVCVFIAGNQNTVSIKVGAVEVDNIAIFARGNRAKGSIEVAEGGKVSQIDVDQRGKDHEVTISGKGQYSCPSMLSLRRPAGHVMKCGE